MSSSWRFHLLRHRDVTGVSGEGIVADGILWPDGTASVRWRGEHPSIVFWDRGQVSVKRIHGHEGATEIVWDDNGSDAGRLARIAEAHSKDQAGHGMTSGNCNECNWSHPCPTYVWATTVRDLLATWDPADDEDGEAEGVTGSSPSSRENQREGLAEARARLFRFIEAGAEEEDCPTFAAALDVYITLARRAAATEGRE
jgi:hypothetical protein